MLNNYLTKCIMNVDQLYRNNSYNSNEKNLMLKASASQKIKILTIPT